MFEHALYTMPSLSYRPGLHGLAGFSCACVKVGGNMLHPSTVRLSGIETIACLLVATGLQHCFQETVNPLRAAACSIRALSTACPTKGVVCLAGGPAGLPALSAARVDRQTAVDHVAGLQLRSSHPISANHTRAAADPGRPLAVCCFVRTLCCWSTTWWAKGMSLACGYVVLWRWQSADADAL